MQANPITRALLEKTGLDSLHVFVGPNRRIVMYPCRSGTLLNVAAFYPTIAGTGAEDVSWHNEGNMDQLLSTYANFGEELRTLCGMAEDLKLWSLASRDPPPTSVKGNMALLGDAAHPTLPRTSPHSQPLRS